MHNLHTSHRLAAPLVALSLLCGSAAAWAQDSHAYMGLALGQARGEFDAQTLLQRQLPAGSALISTSHDRSGATIKLFGGYRFNAFWALEGGYFRLGEFDVQGARTPVGGMAGRIKLQGLNLELVGFLPLAQSWTLTGRAGGVYGHTAIDYQGEGGVVPLSSSASRSTGSVKFGLGLQYALTRTLTLRVDAERYRFDDVAGGHGRINVYTVGLQLPTD